MATSQNGNLNYLIADIHQNKVGFFFGQHIKLKTVPFLPIRRSLSLYTGPRCAINALFINKIL